MTIATILADLAAKHGNDWPRNVLSELIISAVEFAVEETDDQEQIDRYGLLYDWTLSTIHAGIAARQTASLEH